MHTAHLVLAAALSALGVAQTASQGPARVSAVLLGTLGVALAGRAPLGLAGLAAASGALQAAVSEGDPAFASFLVLLVAAYALGRRSARAAVAAGLAVLGLGVLAVVLADPTLQTPGEAVYPVVYLGGATGLGRLVRSRERAAQSAVAAVTAEAQGREQAALAEERARIAREMHDVVAHSLSLLVVQAESAAAVLDHDPERARVQLDRIAGTGRDALSELRRVLGLLRPAGADDRTSPQPSLADLPSLGEAVGSAGTQVHLSVAAGLDELSPGLQLTTYRLVQEALTNAVRHGRARLVQVDVRRDEGVLAVDVRDDGRGGGDGPPGSGLRGMRERVLLYSGELEAGPLDEGGFAVRARIPVQR